MSLVASVVQYPLPCPECKSYTSRPAAVLLSERKITCRVCGTVSRLSDQQLESMARTLDHMNDCGIRRVQIEEPEEQEAMAE